jgi:hypothetical protein
MYLYLNCKKIKLNLFSLLLNLFVFSSCVVYYNTNDIRKTIQTNINQITTNYSKIKIDYNKKTKIYNQLSKYIINPELESFKTISQNKLSFDNVFQKMTQQTNQLMALKNRFEKIVSGKNELKSNDPDWEKLKTIKGQMKELGNEFIGQSEIYTSASNELGNSISNSGYKIAKTTEYINSIQKNTESLEKSILDIKNKLDIYNQDINIAHQTDLISDSTYSSKSEITSEMSQKIKTINQASQKLISLKSIFQKNYNKQEEIWIGKNTKPNLITRKIDIQISTISKAHKEFMGLSSQLNN